jgi:hypothetical protein
MRVQLNEAGNLLFALRNDRQGFEDSGHADAYRSLTVAENEPGAPERFCSTHGILRKNNGKEDRKAF